MFSFIAGNSWVPGYLLQNQNPRKRSLQRFVFNSCKFIVEVIVLLFPVYYFFYKKELPYIGNPGFPVLIPFSWLVTLNNTNTSST